MSERQSPSHPTPKLDGNISIAIGVRNGPVAVIADAIGSVLEAERTVASAKYRHSQLVQTARMQALLSESTVVGESAGGSAHDTWRILYEKVTLSVVERRIPALPLAPV